MTPLTLTLLLIKIANQSLTRGKCNNINNFSKTMRFGLVAIFISIFFFFFFVPPYKLVDDRHTRCETSSTIYSERDMSRVEF